MGKGLKLKVRKFRGLNPKFVEVTGKKLVREPIWPSDPEQGNKSRVARNISEQPARGI